jgi:hypothetical protein
MPVVVQDKETSEKLNSAKEVGAELEGGASGYNRALASDMEVQVVGEGRRTTLRHI